MRIYKDSTPPDQCFSGCVCKCTSKNIIYLDIFCADICEYMRTRPSKMEIYHRDYWIIIVHMAIWKDLTKWNEENTVMDGINHMYLADLDCTRLYLAVAGCT